MSCRKQKKLAARSMYRRPMANKGRSDSVKRPIRSTRPDMNSEQYRRKAKRSAGRCLRKALTKEVSGLSRDRKSTRLNSSHGYISYAVFCLKKKKKKKSYE